MFTTLALAAAVSLSAGPAVAVRLAAPTAGGPVAVEVTGLGRPTLAAIRDAKLTPAEWPAVLRVVVGEGPAAEVAARPPVAGAFAVTADAVRFEPLFPLSPGVRYRVTFAPAAAPRAGLKGGAVTAVVAVPKPPPGPPTTITAVFPTAARLPENTLRWYVHFSAPMRQGDIYRHVKLVRDDGKVVDRPFLEIDEELWSPDGTRVTLLFHPGRVKRGLRPREEDGPVLEEGRRYTLSIDRAWEDAEGRPLTAGFRRTFAAGPPDDTVIDPGTWSLMAPRAGSDAPLIVRLAKPLDRALLGSMLWVTDAAGKKVAGEVTVGGGERVVTFAPAKPWAKGRYKLVADTRLEDVCGNRIGVPFEVDVFHPVQRKLETATAERPFEVK